MPECYFPGAYWNALGHKPRQTGWINKITTLEEPEEKKWSVSNGGKEAQGRERRQ